MQLIHPKSVVGWVGLSLSAAVILAAHSANAMVTRTTAAILNSGSTNTIGYRVYVAPSGAVNYVDGNGQKQGTLSPRLKNKFFKDLKAAMPLSNLAVAKSCMKSTSFGTSTVVVLGGERSPDLSCPGNKQAQALANDIMAITKLLHISNLPRSQGQELPPQNF